MNSLLLVTDDASVQDLFTGEDFALDSLPSADQARRRISLQRPELALVDLQACGTAGLALAVWLRRRHPRVAIVMLGGKDDPIERARNLELGVDDSLSRPFEPRELLARVRAVLRRTAPPPPLLPQQPHDQASFGDCRLDLGGRRLLDASGRELALTPAEFDLLALFARHPNEPLGRARIMAQAHQREWGESDRSIDLRIMRLRRKLEPNPDRPVVLKTVRKVGYMYVQSAVRTD